MIETWARDVFLSFTDAYLIFINNLHHHSSLSFFTSKIILTFMKTKHTHNRMSLLLLVVVLSCFVQTALAAAPNCTEYCTSKFQMIIQLRMMQIHDTSNNDDDDLQYLPQQSKPNAPAFLLWVMIPVVPFVRKLVDYFRWVRSERILHLSVSSLSSRFFWRQVMTRTLLVTLLDVVITMQCFPHRIVQQLQPGKKKERNRIEKWNANSSISS
jgi:hypothetical protein